jgi:phage/conjugal plasmid C-4 type zinc finger TraR family protein
MTDFFDRAAEREEQLRTDALAEQARRAGLEGKTISDSATECSICDSPIPEARRRALPGVQTCVECQADLERELETGRR